MDVLSTRPFNLPGCGGPTQRAHLKVHINFFPDDSPALPRQHQNLGKYIYRIPPPRLRNVAPGNIPSYLGTHFPEGEINNTEVYDE